MTKTKTWISLAALVSWAIACHTVGDGDDEAHDGGVSHGDDEHDRQVCSNVWEDLLAEGCPAGSAPRIHMGSPVSVAPLDDAAISICDGMGYLIDADAVGAAEWVGYDFTQNSVCTVGCVVSFCQVGQDTCLGLRKPGGVCGAYCGRDIDEQSCQDFALACNGVDREDRETGGDACGSNETPGG
jgi:hypothetical protein